MHPAIQDCEDALQKFAESYGSINNVIEKFFEAHKANDLAALADYSLALTELEEELKQIARRHGLYYSPARSNEGVERLMQYTKDGFFSEAENLLNFYGTIIKHYASITHYALHVKWVTSGRPNVPYVRKKSKI